MFMEDQSHLVNLKQKSLRDFVENHPNITIALDYHSQGNVFFPAHDFRHEDTIDTTDMNILCANMAEEIRKISGREYGYPSRETAN